jgi:hypothetical protein
MLQLGERITLSCRQHRAEYFNEILKKDRVREMDDCK